MLRVAEQLSGRAPLYDAALVQHHHLVAQVIHHGEVVADEHVGDAELLLQVLHQVEHLGLYRHVERAHGFVRHDEAGPGDEGTRYGDALALAARKLVRVLAQVVGAQAHLGQHLGGLLALLGTCGLALCLQRLGHDALHGLARVERSVRVLEHHLKIAPRLAQLLCGQLAQVAAQQLDRA